MQRRIKGHLRKLPHSRKQVRVRPHLREVDGRFKRNKTFILT